MTVSIVGTGRVGFCLGVALAKSGHSVLLTDKNPQKKELFAGKIPFYEPQLESYFQSHKKWLKWTRQTDLILSSKYIFFCLSFPGGKKKDRDLTELLEWVKLVPEGKTLIVKSTCPVGAYQKIEKALEGKNISIAVCPEFLREGQAIQDLLEPERVVIGCKNKFVAKKLEEFYKTICRPKKIIHSDPETAELSKLACNSFLGVKISFINEWAGLCESIGGDMKSLQKILGSDSRIGGSFLNPGLGYGGYCLPKDIEMSRVAGKIRGVQMKILKQVQDLNEELPQLFFKKIKKHYKKLNKAELAFWGISFKKNTDNLRNSPALKLMFFLLKAGVKIHVYDPLFTKENVIKVFKNQADFKSRELDYLVKKILEGKVFFYKSAIEALNKREGLIVAGDSDGFKCLYLDKRQDKLTRTSLIDGRSLYSKTDVTQKGFSFYQRGTFLK